MVNNPGKTFSIYDIPGIIKTVLPLAATPVNIMAGFQKTGICPFNDNIFSDSDFLTSYVTDRPAPINKNTELIIDTEELPTVNANVNECPPDAKEDENKINKNEEGNKTFGPDEVRPFPKAAARQTTRKPRRKRRSAILTDTPVKEALKQEKEKIKEKKCPRERNIIVRNRTKSARKSLFRKLSTTAFTSSNRDPILVSEDDTECLICDELYSKSIRGDKWVQCTRCSKWAHEKCIGLNKIFYVCINCNSNDDL
ncbi:uncharacterized protein LOC143264144 [Megachile rotundata]|uniref:uncharacterized protein LOC143264144 n=1 Tax=Megachile rotundata TaxID=143995 RepID=UPI003FCF2CF2